MKNLEELWACEYSYEQDCFHIEPLNYALKTSWEFIARGETDSYMIIGVFEKREEAGEFVVKFREQVLVPTIKENGG